LKHVIGKRIHTPFSRIRIGGRVHTDHDLCADFPVELGGEFIHGEKTVTLDLIREAKMQVIPVVRLNNLYWQVAPHQKAIPRDKLPQAQKNRLSHVYDTYVNMYKHDEEMKTRDRSFAEFLRESGCDEAEVSMADVLIAQPWCCSVDHFSSRDLCCEVNFKLAGKDEFRLKDGYTTFFKWYSHDLNIKQNTNVTKITWSGSNVIVTAGSECFSGKTCIVTIPVGVLKQRINTLFDPPLREKEIALRHMKMEPATKLIYVFDTNILWNPNLTYMGHVSTIARWWTPSYNRDSKQSCITAFILSDRAKVIDSMDEESALQLGLQDLSNLLDIPLTILRRHCVKKRRVSWMSDPYAKGGYATVDIGHYDSRIKLGEPVDQKLFFAGEATCTFVDPQTVHGAIESGWKSAKQCLLALSAISKL
jgi:monoamine oxidase